MRIAIAGGVIAFVVLIVGAGVGFLFLELNKTNIALSAANTDIRELEGQVTGKEAEIENLSDFITEARVINAELVARVEQLQGTLAITQANYDIALTSERSLNEQLSTANASIDVLTREKLDIESRSASIEAQNTTLSRDLSELRTDYRELTAANGDLARVRSREAATQSRIDSLEAEIERLQEQRRPLILPYGAVTTHGVLCTGSMYPAITCMDEGTWLRNFNPEDIVIGATIVFDPICWEDWEEQWPRGIAHRVKEIKVEDGIYYFWPRGDNNREDDGCWVPEDNVSRYLTGLVKDVRPENAHLQSQVLDSRVAWLLAEETYENLLLTYCGHTDASNCSLYGNEYDVVIDAYYKMRDAYRLYECWVQSAKDSNYPGHIPNSCAL